jgi:aryl-alcohol dehydrogenase-like predicted oxidoreductase
MEYRTLGTSGLKVSALGLGTNSFGRRADEQQSKRVIDQALDLGVNFLDTANMYGPRLSEEIIGKALKSKRDQILIATKFGRSMGDGPNDRGASRSHIMEQLEGSLSRLKTDYIDLYQLHSPDPDTPIEETLRALDDCVRNGKVRYIGCSGVTAWQACEAVWTSRMLNLNAFVSVQPYYNLLKREIEKELVPFCRAYGLGLIPYFPLEGGILTGKYRPGKPAPANSRFAGRTESEKRFTKRNFSILGGLERFAEKRGRPVLELALAWLLANPSVSTVIAGATKPEQVVANERSLDWKLSTDELKEIDEIVKNEGGKP